MKIKIVWGTVLTFFALMISLVAYIFPREPTEPDVSWITGIWYSDYSHGITDGKRYITGTTEYFENKRYNVVSKIEDKFSLQGNSIEITYDVLGSGSWSFDSEKFTISLSQIKSSVKSISVNSHVISASEFRKLAGYDFPKIEDQMPLGVSDEYRLLEKSDNQLIFEANDLKGAPFNIVATRTGAHYQREGS